MKLSESPYKCKNCGGPIQSLRGAWSHMRNGATGPTTCKRPELARRPPRPEPPPRRSDDTVAGCAREAQNCLEAVPHHFVKDPDDAIRLLNEAREWIDKAETLCRRAPRHDN